MSAIGELGKISRSSGGGSSSKGHNKAGYLFLAPWLIGLVVVTIGPMIISLYLSFTDYDLLQSPNWIGLQNYIDMFSDQRLMNSLGVTITYVVVSVPLQLLVALVVALVLDRGMRGLPFYRSVFYLPSLLGSSVAIAILWRQIFGTTGLVNQVLELVGIHGPGWISNPDTALSTIILLHIWTFGSPMIIFLAGLRQVPRQFYEAAEVDGANAFWRFFRITLPLMTPIIFFNLVLQIIQSFQSFTQAFVVSNGTGGPSDSTLFYTLYLYKKGFNDFSMGYASALAWLLLAIIGAFTIVNFVAAKYWVFYDD